jgi:hypothetical protein
MSGVIELEGNTPPVQHPLLGKVGTDVRFRRTCRDFPPLAWFTSSIKIPGCLLASDMMICPDDGSPPVRAAEKFGWDAGTERLMMNGMALRRMALGFPLASSPIIRWRDHAGYSTPEGQELNRTAREAGDDPGLWYASEQPVDVLTATEVWGASSIFKPKLERSSTYLAQVHRMVQLCREAKGMHIPPSWVDDQAVQQMIAASKEVPDKVRLT